MGRQPCCDKEAVKKGPWSAEEDRKLVSFITDHGHSCWREVPKRAGLLRCGKSCRLRWINYLRPDLKRGVLSPQEERLIIQLHAAHGNKWSRIAAQLPGRTDNEIKNCWNTRIKKKLREMGIDPVTHKSIPEESSTVSADSSESEDHHPLHYMPAPLPSCNFDTAGVIGHHNSLRHTGFFLDANVYGTSNVLQNALTVLRCADDEESDCSADSVSQDQSISMHGHVFPSIGHFNHLHLPPLTDQQIPHQLQQHMHNPTHHLYMSMRLETPMTHLQNALPSVPQVLHKLPSASPLNLLHLTPLEASKQSMPHLQPACHSSCLQTALHPCKSYEDTGNPTTNSNFELGIKEAEEPGVGNSKADDHESMSGCITDLSSRPIAVHANARDGLCVEDLPWELKGDEEEARGNNMVDVQGGQYWSALVSEALLLETVGATSPTEIQLMQISPFELNEASQQAFGQQNLGSVGNLASGNGGGHWSNMDCSLSEAVVTTYSL